MKQFNWKDAPKGTTHRCTETDTWMRINGQIVSFWNIGLEQWKATQTMEGWALMKMPEPVSDIDWSEAPEGYDYHIRYEERGDGYFYKELYKERNYVQLDGVWISFRDADSDRYVITKRPPAAEIVVLTGRFNTIPRDKLKQLLISIGYIVKGSVNKDTNLLVYGDAPGSKLTKACQLGVSINNEAEAIHLLHMAGVTLPPAKKPQPPFAATEMLKPGSFELPTIVNTEMMLTRSTVFSGKREGTQMTFPARTPVTVVGQAALPCSEPGLVLCHKSTMRYAVVDSTAVKPLMSEEDELVEEALIVVGEYCDDVTVEKLIKAGYRKQPEPILSSSDISHLQWIRDRLVRAENVSRHVDYILRLSKIIKKLTQ